MTQAPARTRPGITSDVSSIKPVLFALFFFSGFCSLLYQVVWLRMAFAQFGVITPVLSTQLGVGEVVIRSTSPANRISSRSSRSIDRAAFSSVR